MPKYKKISIIFIPLIYAIAMFRFYNVDYFVPDYHLYYEFGVRHLWAKDGFSTLFCYISRLADIDPNTMHLVMLMLMSFSLGCFIYLLSAVVKQAKIFFIGLVGIVSIGIWYYLYGKLYYDIPFSFACYGGTLVLITDMYRKKYKDPIIIMKKLSVLFTAMGFCLSWKPYNIFAIAGLASFFICVPVLKEQLYVICKVGNILKLGVLFIFGWVIGNFGLLFDFTETIKGLAAYRAHCDIQYFFFFKDRLIWDHINDLPYNESNINIFTLICILTVIPILLKKWTYLICALFFMSMFCLFIKFFSPGFPWHGFMFSVYVATFFAFMLGEFEKKYFGRYLLCISYAGLIVIVGVQAFFTFVTYLPKQIDWFNATELACNKLRAHQDDILRVTEDVLKSNDGKYDIHCDLKRYKFIGSKERIPVYVDKTNIDKWNELFKDERYVSNKHPDYVVRIYVEDEERLSNVMPPKVYNGFECEDVYYDDGVKIALYNRINDNDIDAAYGAGDCWH